MTEEQSAQQNASHSGLRFQTDRLAQQIGPVRGIDAWGLRHPTANAASFVIIGILFAVVLSIAMHSWIMGTLAGVAIALLVLVATRANHRRRVQNGTSAQYGRPE
jgi:Flp pilus assembly protein TadB